MRLARLLFGLPLAACLVAMAMLASGSPLRVFDHPVVDAYEATHVLAIPDLTITEPAHLALAAEEKRHGALSPAADAYAVAYAIDNQPGADWRIAVDTTFAIIDPHIRGV